MLGDFFVTLKKNMLVRMCARTQEHTHRTLDKLHFNVFCFCRSSGEAGLGRIQLTLRYSIQRQRLVVVVHKIVYVNFFKLVIVIVTSVKDLIPSKDGLFSLPAYPELLRPTHFLSSAYWGSILRAECLEHEVDHSPLSFTEIKNVRNVTSSFS
jgi:hypothetical protein